MSENDFENKWKAFWDKEKVYRFDMKSKKKIYSIDTPPPTVSGKMHMGHAFSYSQQDFIARYKRMRGFNVFYPFGTDDNGLPTEKLVEKTKNIKSKQMSRSEFIKICMDFLKVELPRFIQDWKDIGASCDFDILYSTIDNNSRKISQKFFIELYKMGLIYRKEFPTIWDTVFQTPIAQAELEDKEKESLFSTLKFTISGKELLIATTRPELLGACVAVFVNPDDKRYKSLVGGKAKVPLFDFEVPIIADTSAEMEKGTGILMVCSYGDKFDVDAIQRHKLQPRVILNKDGTLNIEGYKGLNVKQAREKILEDLQEKKLIKEQKKITHVVNVYEKSGNEIEFIPTEQWFIKILDKKKDFVKEARKINWRPEFMFKRYENWVNGLEWDWSVSRERHFGIPIPVWVCEKCNEVILADEKELPIDPSEKSKVCKKCGGKGIGEKRVLDTWATSSLTPEIASSLVGGKIKVPYSLRPQAHDIIRTWAFYTIVRSYYHNKNIPWKDIVISGNVKLHGEKMSKSKGNVVEPQLIVKNYGGDALRFWAASSKLGEDLDYSEKEVIAGKKFVTKLLNASNFVFMNLKDYKPKKVQLLEMDRLFLNELNKVVVQSVKDFDNYEYHKVKSNIDNFFWKVFCDYYLEIVKKRVYLGKGKDKESAAYALYTGLLTLLRLYAPFTPFVTEEVYQNHFKVNEKMKSVHLLSWPEKVNTGVGKINEKVFERMIEIIAEVRKMKSENKKAMNSEIVLTLDKKDHALLKGVVEDLKNVTNSREVKIGKFGVEFV